MRLDKEEGYAFGDRNSDVGIKEGDEGFDIPVPVIRRPSRTRQSSLRDCQHRLTKLFKNPRFECITLAKNGIAMAFRVKKSAAASDCGVAFPGITKRIKLLMYPKEYDPASRNKRISKEIRKEKKRTGKSATPRDMTRHLVSACPTKGKEHGTLVHSQIELYTDLFVVGTSVESFRKIYPNPDPCFCRFVNLTEKLKWYPIKGELKIYDEDIGCATAIDLVLIDSVNDQILVVDIKTGYEGLAMEEHASDPYLPYPLQEYKAYPFYVQYIQMAMIAMILKRKYRFVPDRFVIIHIEPKTFATTIVDMPPWFFDKKIMDELYGVFRAYNVRKKKEKEKKRERGEVIGDDSE
jgi:hypothetical protein